MLNSPVQLPAKEEERPIHLQNYSSDDFTMSYLDDKNISHDITIPALDTKEFPSSIGKIVRNHLADFILNKQGFSYKTDPKIELAKIKEKITIYE